VNVTQAKDSAGIIIGAVGGDIAAQDDASADTVIIGKVGPAGEAGIKAGTSNAATLFRGANNEWTIDDDLLRIKRSAGATAFAAQSDSDTNPRVELGTFGIKLGGGSGATDVRILRQSSSLIRFRNAGDSAYVSIGCLDATVTGALDHDGSTLGVFATAPTTKQTVTGSRGGNAALASLLTALAAYGLVTDSSSA
jgi:hypothetical protein